MPVPSAKFQNFLRGVVDAVSGDVVPDDGLTDAHNMVYDKIGSLKSRPGADILGRNRNVMGDVTEDFRTAVMTTNSNVSVTANTMDSPLGDQTCDDVSDTSAAAHGYLGRINATGRTIAAGEKWTISVWVKVPTTSMGAIQLSFSGSSTENFTYRWGEHTDDTQAQPGVWVEGSPGATYGYGDRISYTDTVSSTTVTMQQLWLTGPNTDPANTSVAFYLWPSRRGLTASGGASVAGAEDVTLQDTLTVWGVELYPGGFRPGYPNLSGNAWDPDVQYETGSCRSVHFQRDATGAEAIYATWGSKIFRYDATNDWWDNETNGFVISDSAAHKWVNYNGAAIMLTYNSNLATGKAAIQFTTASATAANLGDTVPHGKYLAVWNDRLWIAHDEQNTDRVTIYGSALGNPADWADTDPASGTLFAVIGDSTQEITGLAVYQRMLVVFLRDSIWAVMPGSSPTDATQLMAEQITNRVGSVGGTSAVVDNDLWFMAGNGLMSLRAVQEHGDAVTNRLSFFLDDFRDLDPRLASTPHWIVPLETEGIVFVEGFSPGLTGVSTRYLYAFHMLNGGQGPYPATKIWFAVPDGEGETSALSVPNCGALATISDEEYVLFGMAGGTEDANMGSVLVWNYSGDYADAGYTYTQKVSTAWLTLGDRFLRKLLARWAIQLRALYEAGSVTVTFEADLDESASQAKTLTTATGKMEQYSRRFVTSGIRRWVHSLRLTVDNAGNYDYSNSNANVHNASGFEFRGLDVYGLPAESDDRGGI